MLLLATLAAASPALAFQESGIILLAVFLRPFQTKLPRSLIPSLIAVLILVPSLAIAPARRGPNKGIVDSIFIILENGFPNKESNKLLPAALAF